MIVKRMQIKEALQDPNFNFCTVYTSSGGASVEELRKILQGCPMAYWDAEAQPGPHFRMNVDRYKIGTPEEDSKNNYVLFINDFITQRSLKALQSKMRDSDSSVTILSL